MYYEVELSMPLAKGAQNITIRAEVFARLKQKLIEKQQRNALDENKKIGSFVNDLLIDVLEKDKFLSVMMPYYSPIGIHDNTLFIKDERNKKVAEIYLKDHTLYCDLDQTQDCEHIHFAYAIPEVAKLNIPSTKEKATEDDLELDGQKVKKATDKKRRSRPIFHK